MTKEKKTSNVNMIDLTESNDNLIEGLTSIPTSLVDEIIYTAQYCSIAQYLGNNRSKEKGFLDKRYRKNLDVLENDLEAAPIIIKRLESILEKFSKESLTYQFAQKYLPFVKEFYEILEWYNNPKEIKR
ncbi:MAG: hypothetical protein ACP5NZ_00810 [Nanobdellota archaeon]